MRVWEGNWKPLTIFKPWTLGLTETDREWCLIMQPTSGEPVGREKIIGEFCRFCSNMAFVRSFTNDRTTRMQSSISSLSSSHHTRLLWYWYYGIQPFQLVLWFLLPQLQHTQQSCGRQCLCLSPATVWCWSQAKLPPLSLLRRHPFLLKRMCSVVSRLP